MAKLIFYDKAIVRKARQPEREPVPENEWARLALRTVQAGEAQRLQQKGQEKQQQQQPARDDGLRWEVEKPQFDHHSDSIVLMADRYRLTIADDKIEDWRPDSFETALQGIRSLAWRDKFIYQ